MTFFIIEQPGHPTCQQPQQIKNKTANINVQNSSLYTC